MEQTNKKNVIIIDWRLPFLLLNNCKLIYELEAGITVAVTILKWRNI